MFYNEAFIPKGFKIDVLDIFEVEEDQLRNRLRRGASKKDKKAKKSKDSSNPEDSKKKGKGKDDDKEKSVEPSEYMVILRIRMSKKSKMKHLTEWLSAGGRSFVFETDTKFQSLSEKYKLTNYIEQADLARSRGVMSFLTMFPGFGGNAWNFMPNLPQPEGRV